MNIKEVIAQSIATDVEFDAVVSNKFVGVKQNGDKFITLTLSDNTGSVEMPVWDNVDTCDAVVNVGTALRIFGKRIEYSGAPQIRYGRSTILTLTPKDIEERFVPSYKVEDAAKVRFFELLLSIENKQYQELLKAMLGVDAWNSKEWNFVDKDKWEAFYNSPSAVKHHGNKIHGLFLHTLGVMSMMDSMICQYTCQETIFPNVNAEKTTLDKDLLMFVAIAHDIDKTRQYKYFPVICSNKDLFVDHDVLFIETLGRANMTLENPLQIEELSKIMLIVLTHHGQWSAYKHDARKNLPVEAELLHLADMADARIIGLHESV